MELSETLRMLADDLEQRPSEKCWQINKGLEPWVPHTPEEAVFYLSRGVRRMPKSSRQRFEEWFPEIAFTASENHCWAAWQEAERQAKEAGDDL